MINNGWLKNAEELEQTMKDIEKYPLKIGITPERLAQSGSESGHQQALMCWSQQNLIKYPELKWLTAIPNGGYRDKITAGKLKAEGVKPGVPDLLLLVKRGKFACLWIEMKKPEVGKLSKEQKEWLDQAKSQGHAAWVCFGWEQARNALVNYLEHKE